MLHRAIFVLAASSTLLGAGEPNERRSSFDDFADAAVACIGATQRADFDPAPIISQGWEEYSQPREDVAELVTTYSNATNRVAIIAMKQPPQCTASWYVTSSSGVEAVFDAADAVIADRLAEEFDNHLTVIDPRDTEQGQVHQFIAADAVGTLVLEGSGNFATVQFMAIHKSHYAKLIEARSSRAGN